MINHTVTLGNFLLEFSGPCIGLIGPCIRLVQTHGQRIDILLWCPPPRSNSTRKRRTERDNQSEEDT
ncbi:hypothetical protein AOT96_22005 [Rhodococcus sp. 008]|nr:hypothetical protein AOT96_22005 [Rhodococcus sp. 008]